MFRADLHSHTTCSDGTVDPKKLIDIAVQLDLSGLSITDHDTVMAYESALPYALEKGFSLLPGAEFSSFFQGESVHILAYGFQLGHPDLKAFCNYHYERRVKRMKEMIFNLNKVNVSITYEEVVGRLEGENHYILGRPHIAQLLIEKGIVSSFQNAFKHYLVPGAPGYVPNNSFSVEETLELIKVVKGKAVLAHPHIYKKKIIPELLNYSFDGIEGYYGRCHPDREKEWVEIGEERGWIITGGSDYHGTVKPKIPLGCSWVGDTVFNLLYQHYLQVNNEL
jgi:3',5'-nucleoside bisphosphate phosphatase